MREISEIHVIDEALVINDMCESCESWVSGQATHGYLVKPIALFGQTMSEATHHQRGGASWKPALTTKWEGEWGGVWGGGGGGHWPTFNHQVQSGGGVRAGNLHCLPPNWGVCEEEV